MAINKNIFANRLREARELRALTITELSSRIGITKQAISDYENGKKKPTTEVMIKLISELKLPYAFFTSEVIREDENSVFLNFRKYSNTSDRTEKQSFQLQNQIGDIYSFLEGHLDLPTCNIPSFEGNFLNLDSKAIDKIATDTRRFWGLGDGPIGNLIRLLENNGIVCSKIPVAEKVDAFSGWKGNVPIIILTSLRSAVRIRFDAAHELGHLILHRNLNKNNFSKAIHKIKEDQANLFGSSFLLPDSTFPKEVISPNIERFLMLKKRWGVSLQAMVMRYYTLGYINPNQKTYLFKKLAKYRKFEPYDDEIIQEETKLFNQAFEVLIQNNIGKETILNSINLYSDELIELANLDSKIFNYSSPSIIQMKNRI